MNKPCLQNCAYGKICKVSAEAAARCKIAEDSAAQDFRRSTIFGIKTETIIKKQYKK